MSKIKDAINEATNRWMVEDIKAYRDAGGRDLDFFGWTKVKGPVPVKACPHVIYECPRWKLPFMKLRQKLFGMPFTMRMIQEK